MQTLSLQNRTGLEFLADYCYSDEATQSLVELLSYGLQSDDDSESSG